MKLNRLITVALLCALPLGSFAQTKHKKHHHKAKTAATDRIPGTFKNDQAVWMKSSNYKGQEHVYFPDYYTFYDPKRGGYMFWENGKWSFTPTMPPYMQQMDMSKDRVQVLKGLSLDLHPELDYPSYMKLYPAVHEYNDVPVPHSTQIPNGQ